MRRRLAAAGLALVVWSGVAGCADEGRSRSADPSGSRSPSGAASWSQSQSPSPSPSRSAQPTGAPDAASYSDWELGNTQLPVGPDGFGEVRPTPKPLRERRFRTVDLLPPPADGRFHGTVGAVTDAIRARMGETWSPACPVALDGLRYLTVTFRGFDGAAHTGELVVAASEAEDVVSVFRALYAAGFPIEEMRLPTTADLDAAPTGDGNDTAGLVCRATRGATSWSAHAYGLAIDVNPFMNPYHRDDLVLPELASSYLDRRWVRPGMVLPGSVAVREFARIGWSWGGAWSSLKDYQHFTATGR